MSIGHARHEEFERLEDQHEADYPAQAMGEAVGGNVNDVFVAARIRVSPLTVLPATSLPSVFDVAALAPVRAAVAGLAAANWSIEALVDAISALEREIGPLPKPVPLNVAEMLETGARADFASHDYFFHVNRAPEASTLLFARSTLQAILHLRLDVAEAPASLTDGELSELEFALRRLLQPHVAPAAGEVTFARPVGAVPADFIQARWLRGHQVFAALTQGLIAVFIALDEAVKREAWDEAFIAADMVAALFRGSDFSLRHTGDFPAYLYDTTVKPCMEPPYMPEGFSGLLSSDHHYMVRLMREGRGVLDRLKEKSPERHAAIGTTLAGVYDSHKMVCGKFAGTERGSLLLASPCKRAAVDQIDAFKKTRLRTSGFMDEAAAGSCNSTS